MHHWMFGALALFCLIHIYRDYLQIKHGMVVFAILAIIFGYSAIH